MAKQFTNITDSIGAFINNHNDLTNKVGDLSNLNTTDDSSLVGAINEIGSSGGVPATGIESIMDSYFPILLDSLNYISFTDLPLADSAGDFVFRTTTQTINGSKTFSNLTYFTDDISVTGTNPKLRLQNPSRGTNSQKFEIVHDSNGTHFNWGDSQGAVTKNLMAFIQDTVDPNLLGSIKFYTGDNTLVGSIDSAGVVDANTLMTRAKADARYLQQTNNLSDVANTSTARTNIGVAIGTDVQAWDSSLDVVSSTGVTPYGAGLLNTKNAPSARTYIGALNSIQDAAVYAHPMTSYLEISGDSYSSSGLGENKLQIICRQFNLDSNDSDFYLMKFSATVTPIGAYADSEARLEFGIGVLDSGKPGGDFSFSNYPQDQWDSDGTIVSSTNFVSRSQTTADAFMKALGGRPGFFECYTIVKFSDVSTPATVKRIALEIGTENMDSSETVRIGDGLFTMERIKRDATGTGNWDLNGDRGQFSPVGVYSTGASIS